MLFIFMFSVVDVHCLSLLDTRFNPMQFDIHKCKMTMDYRSLSASTPDHHCILTDYRALSLIIAALSNVLRQRSCAG